MSVDYRITREEVDENAGVRNVYYTFGITDEGNITVPKSMTDGAVLDALIQLQISRRKEQLEQLAAGGE